MAQDEALAFDQTELRALFRALKAMDDEGQAQAKEISGGLASYLKDKITITARGRGQDSKAATRIAEGSRVKKSSKIGELSIGFASQRFSGGGTTQMLWGGNEFGSNKYKQFPVWSGREGRGSKGWFIYPTLRKEQPYIIKEWEAGFAKIARKWDSF
jgi:hypothetical protein